MPLLTETVLRPHLLVATIGAQLDSTLESLDILQLIELEVDQSVPKKAPIIDFIVCVACSICVAVCLLRSLEL